MTTATKTTDSAFEKGVRLMEALARSESAIGVTNLAEELTLTKSNVHRLLRSLVAMGYAHQEPGTEHYFATIKFWELGFRVISRLEVRSFALPYMRELAKITNEQINLAVLDNEEIVYIDKIESTQAVHAPIRIGYRSPVYGVALGKAMLAYQSPLYVTHVLRNMRRFTSRTLSSPDALQKELLRVRSAGYATNKGEWREGVAGIAAPILASPEHAVAAIGISGPSERLRPKELTRYASIVIEAAKGISETLGYRSAQRKRKIGDRARRKAI